MHSPDTDELYTLNVNALIECLIAALFIFKLTSVHSL